MIVASAPGKLVLAGEYVVLEGAPAVVAAVQTRATVTLGGPAAPSLPPEVVATRALLESRFGAVSGGISLDVEALRAGDRKLGVGSSAAASVAAAAACLADRGIDPGSREALATILEAALGGHRAVAPRGSGIDVAASTHGGILRFERRGDGVFTQPLALPPALHLSVVFTGESARTSDLLDAVDAFASRSAASHRNCMSNLRRVAERFADAFAAGDVTRIVAEAAAYHDAMRSLGEAAGAPIVETRLATLAALAREHGGAGKPSGAGGGDVAVAFFDASAKRVSFERACRDRGFTVLDAKLGGPGVRLEPERAEPDPVR